MKISRISAILIVFFTMVPAAWSAEKAASSAVVTLVQFDDEVAQCRRVIRDYCAIMQRVMQEKSLDKDAQDKGLSLLKDAREKWAEIAGRYAVARPAEYAADRQFAARLKDISNAIEDMEKALANGDARRSFMACGYGCGLFVSMHEDNGLNYALDKLFHLRKDLKTCQAVMKAKGLDGIRSRMAGLLQKRDAVLMAPPPFAASDSKFAGWNESLRTLSTAIDELAMAVSSGNAEEVNRILADSVNVVNKPYGIAL